MYKYIINPLNNKQIKLNSINGRKILKKFIKTLNRYKLAGGSNNTFYMFYVDWCGACQQTKPHFEKLVSKNIKMINYEEDKYKPIVDKYKEYIKYYPTILLNKDGKNILYDNWVNDNKEKLVNNENIRSTKNFEIFLKSNNFIY